MTTRLTRGRPVAGALERLHTRAARTGAGGHTPEAAVEPHDPLLPLLDAGAVVPPRTTDALAQIRRLARSRRRGRVRGWRRVGAAVAAVVVAGFGSSLFVGIAAAGELPANSVLSYGAAPDLGPDGGLALRAGVVAIATDPTAPGYWLTAADGGVFTFGKTPFYGSAADRALNAPVVGIAAARRGEGYWLAGADGGVFAFGRAPFLGSLAGRRLRAPIVAIVRTRDGLGYWLVAADGGVFAFGDARFHGSASGFGLHSPIVAAAATRDGEGYWLLGADGGVFSFGDARFEGARLDSTDPAVGIAAAPRGRGYWIARADGIVSSFGVSGRGRLATTTATSDGQTVAIAASARGGYWLAEGPLPPPVAPSNDPFLACTRAHESDGSGGYHAVSPGGTYRGAYQFDQSTWNSAARLAGRPDLVGVDPATASPPDQDLLALTLFHSRGTQPWGGRCSGMP